MIQNERREFLKKVAYTAPTILALGTLSTATDANAANIPSNLIWIRSKFNKNDLRVSVWQDGATGEKYKFVYNQDGSLKKTVILPGSDNSDD